MAVVPELWIDGQPASAEDLAHQALFNYGALTSFRVEDGCVRGLDLHLARLAASAEQLFGVGVDQMRLRDLMRDAVAGRADVWLRVSLFSRELSLRRPDRIAAPQVMTAVSAPPAAFPDRVRLQTQLYSREVPHLKHTGTFGLLRARRTARLAGFDDALFVDETGRILEGSLWNIGFIDGDTVVWPRAAKLDGVAQALIGDAIDRSGGRQRVEPVRLSDLPRFCGAFLCNSAVPAAAIAAINDHAFPDTEAARRIADLWRSQPCQAI